MTRAWLSAIATSYTSSFFLDPSRASVLIFCDVCTCAAACWSHHKVGNPKQRATQHTDSLGDLSRAGLELLRHGCKVQILLLSCVVLTINGYFEVLTVPQDILRLSNHQATSWGTGLALISGHLQSPLVKFLFAAGYGLCLLCSAAANLESNADRHFCACLATSKRKERNKIKEGQKNRGQKQHSKLQYWC